MGDGGLETGTSLLEMIGTVLKKLEIQQLKIQAKDQQLQKLDI